jgi:hypothetical protein
LRCFEREHKPAEGQGTMAQGMAICSKAIQLFYTLRLVPRHN